MYVFSCYLSEYFFQCFLSFFELSSPHTSSPINVHHIKHVLPPFLQPAFYVLSSSLSSLLAFSLAVFLCLASTLPPSRVFSLSPLPLPPLLSSSTAFLPRQCIARDTHQTHAVCRMRRGRTHGCMGMRSLSRYLLSSYSPPCMRCQH